MLSGVQMVAQRTYETHKAIQLNGSHKNMTGEMGQ